MSPEALAALTCVTPAGRGFRGIFIGGYSRGVVVLGKRQKIRRVNCTRRAISVCPSKCVASSTTCGLSPFQINSAAGFPLSDRQRLEGKTFIRSVSDRCGISYHTTPRARGSPLPRGLRMNTIHLSMHHMLCIKVFAAVLNSLDSIRLDLHLLQEAWYLVLFPNDCQLFQHQYITTVR